jgi:hypothetical protein
LGDQERFLSLARVRVRSAPVGDGRALEFRERAENLKIAVPAGVVESIVPNDSSRRVKK